MEEGEFSEAESRINGGTAEELIAGLREDPVSRAYCWIICYEERPLQGAPQNSMEPHLMIFSTKTIGNAFIQGRKRYFGNEPVALVPVDSAGTLKKLALAEADDSRYTAPPCGLLLNFSYSTAQADVTLSPREVENTNEEELAQALGLRIPKAAKVTEQEEKPGDPTVCPLCNHKLYMPQRGGGISIGFGDEALEAMMSRQRPDPAHTAYACKKCGTRICQTCATKYVCPRCQNNTFDRFDLAALPPPPPLPVKRAQKKPRTAKAPSPKPRIIPAIKVETPPAAEAKPAAVQPTPAPQPGAVPAPRPAAPSGPRWWMIAAGAAVLIALLAIGPWARKRVDSPPAASPGIPTQVGNNSPAAASTPGEDTSNPSSKPVLTLGSDQWTLRNYGFVDTIDIPGREVRKAPAGSRLLIADFRSDTARNPLTTIDPSNPEDQKTLFHPDGIEGIHVTDEIGAIYPVQLIEVLFSGEEQRVFMLMAVVPEPKDTYVLHFLDSAPMPFGRFAFPDPAAGQTPGSTSTVEIAEIPPTLAPFRPFSLPGGEKFGRVVTISPQETYASSGNCDGTVRLWLIAKWDAFKDYSGPDVDCVFDIAFTADESRMAVSFGNQGVILVFDVPSGALQGALSMPRVDHIEFSHRGDWLAAGSHGEGTALWDMTKFAEMQGSEWKPFIIPGDKINSFTCLEFDPFDNYLAIGEGPGGVMLWDLQAGRAARHLSEDCAAPRSMSFSLNGKYLYYSDFQTMNSTLVESGEVVHQRDYPFEVTATSAFVPRLEFTANIKFQSIGSMIEIWNNYEGNLMTTLEGHKNKVWSIQFSEDGSLLLSGGFNFESPDSGEVYLWNTSSILP